MNTKANSGKSILINGVCWGEFHQWDWNGFQCHWRVLGEKNNPPIVFIHGFGASSAHWRNNAEFFVNAGYRVYALDLVGFGISEQPGSNKQKTLDNFFWSKQVSAFLNEIVGDCHQEKAVLIGNSLGSLVAITTAFFNAHLVKAVVASPLPDPAFMQPIVFPDIKLLDSLKALLVKIFFKLLPLELLLPLIARSPIIRIALQFAYHQSVSNDIDLFRLISVPAKRITAPRSLRAMCVGMTLRLKEFTAPYMLEKLSKRFNRCPVLLIWGEKDKLVPLSLGQLIAKQHPWIDFQVIDNSGHCAHDESPNQFNQNVFTWLGGHKFSINTQTS